MIGDGNSGETGGMMHFFQPPEISSLFGPNIVLSTLFSNSFTLYCSLYVRD
jgi:hypothetical protein